MYRLKFPAHATLDYIATQQALRTAKMLLTDTSRRRHQKLVDPATGTLLGYARWTLPSAESAPEVASWWPCARGPKGSAEAVEEAERAFTASEWPHDGSLDPVPDPIDESTLR